MTRVAAVLGALSLALVGCSGDDDDAPTSTTGVTVTLGEGLPVGASYEDPSGQITLTVRGVRITGGLLLADAEACSADDAIPGLPIQAMAWQLRVRGQDSPVPMTVLEEPNRAASPPWPESVALEPGDCFVGKVAFELPDDGQPRAVVFTQLNQPVAWRIRS
jgi:hypothetical protein